MVEIEKEWPYKLLTREMHGRLVANLADICAQSGVREDMIDISMADCGCSSSEIEWVKDFHQSSSGGLLISGITDPSGRFMAMAAAFLRNFIDARVVHILAFRDDDGFNIPDATVLLIPDFCRKTGHSGLPMATWQMRQLQSVIMDRFARRRATVLYTESMKQLETEHGKSFYEFVLKHWDILG